MKICVLGCHRSGSGLIFDLLTKTNVCFDPFDGKEPLFLTNPGGVLDFYKIVYPFSAISVQTAAYDRLCKSLRRWGRSTRVFNPGLGFDSSAVKYRETVDWFLGEIASLHLPFKSYHFTTLPRPIGQRLSRFERKLHTLAVPNLQFVSLVQRFISRLVEYEGPIESAIAINQGADFLMPYESLALFGYQKIIRVIRDPVDHYFSLKKNKAIENACQYIAFRQQIEDSLAAYPDSEDVLTFQFEDIVINFRESATRLAEFIGCDETLFFEYPIEESGSTIGLGYSTLHSDEISFIRQALSNPRKH